MNERSIFAAALDITDATERAAYLDQACGQEPGLRGHIEGLLAEQDQLGSFLARPLAAPTVSVRFDPVTEGPGTTIGPYKLLQQIGEGGMGVVYMADQETPVRRRVALKIIKPGMDTAQVVARFEAERQALAMMDHTNIARVFDAATTDSGRPYFVMELVHGVPITTYCDSNQLTPRERLALFVPVCQAIQHAHQKGIIHRDIKPSNVLVTMYDDRPVPKVIDFGVAKAVEQRLTERTLFTQYGALVGTFEYMSPEQAEMNAFGVDTRSDVFSLGVLLYELLTGTTPLERQRLRTAALGELIRLIKEEDPERPSARLSGSGDLPKLAAARNTEPARLSRLVRGEVDWIVMKCLEKDRTRRYETASALARDVERHLKDEPVEACPPSAGYRLRKLTRKYRAPLLVAAGFVLLLMSGVVASTWQAARATRAERQALSQRDGAALAERAAVVAERAADRKRQEAETARESLRQALYASDIERAHAAWNANNILQMRALLDDQRPRPGEADLRGFEWHYLRRLGSTVRTLKPLPGALGGALSPDGTRFVHALRVRAPGKAGGLQFKLRLWDTASGSELRGFAPFPGQTAVREMGEGTFSRDGKRYAFVALVRDSAGAERWGLNAWEWDTGRDLFTLPDLPDTTGALTFDPAGLRLAMVWPRPKGETGCDLKVWQVDGGKELLSVPLPDREGPGCRQGIAFSPDGVRLAAFLTRPAGPGNLPEESEVVVWEAGTGKELLRFAAAPGSIYGRVVYSPDGNRLAVADSAEPIRIQDSRTGAELLRITSAAERSTRFDEIAFSFDGTRLAVASRDGKLRIWDVASAGTEGDRPPARVLEAIHSPLWSVAWSADGQFVWTSDINGTILQCDLAVHDRRVVMPGASHEAPAISSDASRFAAAFPSSLDLTEVKVWDETGKVLFTATDDAHMDPQDGRRYMMTKLSRDGERVGYFTLDSRVEAGKRRTIGRLRVWDVTTRREMFHRDDDQGWFVNVVFHPDGNRLATTWITPEGFSRNHSSRVSIWDVAADKEVLRLELPSSASGSRLVFSPDGLRLAATLKNRSDEEHKSVLRIWDASTGKVVLNREWPFDFIGRPAYNAEGTLLATAIGEWWGPSAVKVLDAASGEELHSLAGHRHRVEELVFSPDGRRLASSAYTIADFYHPDGNTEVKIWDVAGGRQLLSLAATGDGSLAFSRDGRRLTHVSAVYKKGAEVQVWDATPLPEEQTPIARRLP